jgi:hypothetical protein
LDQKPVNTGDLSDVHKKYLFVDKVWGLNRISTPKKPGDHDPEKREMDTINPGQ